jgi:DnaK suppressor protein
MRVSVAREIRNLKQELLRKESEERLGQQKRQIETAIARDLRAIEEMREATFEDETREVDYRYRQNLQAMLRHLDEALQRLTDKTFGRCVDCGKNIEGKRLQIAPTVSRCLACQSVLESSLHIVIL